MRTSLFLAESTSVRPAISSREGFDKIPVAGRGAAMVVLKERGNYHLSWHGKALLVAQEQVRAASHKETMAADEVAEEVKESARRFREANG